MRPAAASSSMSSARSAESPYLTCTSMPVSVSNRSKIGWTSSSLRPGVDRDGVGTRRRLLGGLVARALWRQERWCLTTSRRSRMRSRRSASTLSVASPTKRVVRWVMAGSVDRPSPELSRTPNTDVRHAVERLRTASASRGRMSGMEQLQREGRPVDEVIGELTEKRANDVRVGRRQDVRHGLRRWTVGARGRRTGGAAVPARERVEHPGVPVARRDPARGGRLDRCVAPR